MCLTLALVSCLKLQHVIEILQERKILLVSIGLEYNPNLSM